MGSGLYEAYLLDCVHSRLMYRIVFKIETFNVMREDKKWCIFCCPGVKTKLNSRLSPPSPGFAPYLLEYLTHLRATVDTRISLLGFSAGGVLAIKIGGMNPKFGG